MTRHVTPTCLQMEATECGAAALGSILAYYQAYYSLAYLRELCGVSRDGSKANHLLNAARALGLEAQAYQVDTLADLLTLKSPSILFWGFNHFVVFEGEDQGKYYINDPAIGHRELTENEFSELFTGVVLTFQRSPTFKPQGEAIDWRESLLRRIGHARETLYFCLWLGLALVVPGLLIPGFSLIFIDDILVRETQTWMTPFLVGMGITAIFRGFCTYLQQSQLMKWQTQRLAVTSLQFTWHILQLPLSFFTQRYVGDIQERVAANERVAEWLTRGITNHFMQLMMFIFYVAMMLLFSISLGLIGLIILAINTVFLWFTVKRIADTSFVALQKNGQLLGLEVSGLNRIETIKSRGAEAAFFTRWAGIQANALNAQHNTAIAAVGLQWIPKALVGLANALMIGIGGLLVMRGQMTLGALIAVQSLFTSIQAPLQSLIDVAATLPRIKGDFARIDDVLQYPEDSRYEEARQLSKPLQFKGDLSLNQVCFSYAKLEKPFIQIDNINIKAGSRVSIVGLSGSGKSTLAKLIAGLYQPSAGEITIDDQNIQHWDQKTFVKNIALVEQETYLFSGSLKENLTYWNQSITDQEIETLLQQVDLDNALNCRGGLSAVVKEGGVNFSGGERQRIELVRALLRKPALLILDEATSALSATAEKAIFELLKTYSFTLINIAHRLATVELTDEVIVLDQGVIVQHGKPSDLLATPGLYQTLYHAEARSKDGE